MGIMRNVKDMDDMSLNVLVGALINALEGEGALSWNLDERVAAWALHDEVVDELEARPLTED